MKNNNFLSTIGHTPLIKLATDTAPAIFAKLEMMNPTLSIKDRIVEYMINAAEKRGVLKKGATIIEASSGNTGASLAMMGALKNYPVIITTTTKTSSEKIAMMKLYGATVHICDADLTEESPNHYITLAKQLASTMPNAYFLNQYNNSDNPDAHYHTTGPEIWMQTEGQIDYLVATGSTGGTISGAGRFLKEKNKNIKVILADPVGSCYFSYFKAGKINQSEVKPYQVEGAGKNQLCRCMDFSQIDDVIAFTDQQAFETVNKLALKEGIFAGGSSGGALFVAKVLAANQKNPANIVVILPDSGIKYSYLLR